MSQSLVNNYVHIIFSTKHREPLILPHFEQELHAYLGRECNRLECTLIAIGGYVDHVHILCMLSKKIAIMQLLKTIKSHSSIWIKEQHSVSNFYWQDGYGAFSVSPTDVVNVSEYISNQHIHHRQRSFQEEYRMVLKKYKVEYDERYVWD